MSGATAPPSLEQARALILRGDFIRAELVLNAAIGESSDSFEVRRALAGVYRQTGRGARAEALLRELLEEQPQDFGSAFTLAQLLIEQARTQAAAQVMRRCFKDARHDVELAIRAIELLDKAERKADAAAIAESASTAAPNDPRLHAYAGMLLLQLGEFAGAREHYLLALAQSPQACEWHVPHGLASSQRYADRTHPDFARLHECENADLSDKARATLLFALGKAHDDIGEYAQAAAYFGDANALAHGLSNWSRKSWRRTVEARLASPPITPQATPADDLVPIFIVGMPRSGTTLLAELLARHPDVCNRGELPWIAKLAEQSELNGRPSAEALTQAAVVYARQARRDDASDAHWFIDKQPLNFRYADLMLAIFPSARIIHCVRNPRDTALSLWMQSFSEDVQGYAYDFDDIDLVMRDCARLMTHWQRRYPHSIRTVDYEQLVEAPRDTMAGLVAWIGLQETDIAANGRPSAISTASLWQARQPVYSHSLQRWRKYAEHIPELLNFADR